MSIPKFAPTKRYFQAIVSVVVSTVMGEAQLPIALEQVMPIQQISLLCILYLYIDINQFVLSDQLVISDRILICSGIIIISSSIVLLLPIITILLFLSLIFIINIAVIIIAKMIRWQMLASTRDTNQLQQIMLLPMA